ncbi:unnamed protein product [Cylicocyclus nassatus]|uniref:UNC93-like protein MFSD11 n=1 Tax=Cylicocyclus nassatus TaxID=53992 RepID=A0AA36HFZ4_CYLNA|nr:unnamed protein product [Cylicocyclus nassatus]
MGAVIHLITFALIYMNFPNDAPLQKTEQTGNVLSPSVAIALVCGLLLGFGDACWNTQIYAFLCDKFPQKSSEAFAIFKFYQSLLSCAAFFYSPYLQLPWHLLILLVTSILAAVCFFLNQRFPSLFGPDEGENEVKTIPERGARSFDSGEQIICQDTPHLSSKAAD